MRPQGQVRAALLLAAQQLLAERDGATWRDLADRAQVGYQAARSTADNMARAGDLQAVGFEKRAHSVRWMTLYAPRQATQPGGSWATQTTGGALADVMHGWPR